MSIRLITEPTDDVIESKGPTDMPIIPRGLDVRLRCRDCAAVFHLSECSRWIPGGHKKWNEFECPECGTRVAREKGSNRAFNEELYDLTTQEAFDRSQDDADEYDLVPGGQVHPEEIGDTVPAVFEYFPHNGTVNRLTIVADDVQESRWDEAEAEVEWYDGYVKPIGYGETAGDKRTAADVIQDCDSILRFLRKR